MTQVVVYLTHYGDKIKGDFYCYFLWPLNYDGMCEKAFICEFREILIAHTKIYTRGLHLSDTYRFP